MISWVSPPCQQNCPSGPAMTVPKRMCVRKDDFAQILNEIHQVDAIIAESPFYYNCMAAQALLVVSFLPVSPIQSVPGKRWGNTHLYRFRDGEDETPCARYSHALHHPPHYSWLQNGEISQLYLPKYLLSYTGLWAENPEFLPLGFGMAGLRYFCERKGKKTALDFCTVRFSAK